MLAAALTIATVTAVIINRDFVQVPGRRMNKDLLPCSCKCSEDCGHSCDLTGVREFSFHLTFVP
jgi:hypothetical protein